MTHQEAGSKGGTATGKRWGLATCPHCGSQYVKGDWYKDNGRKGGEATARNHGADHYRRMGQLGGRGNTRAKRMARERGLSQD